MIQVNRQHHSDFWTGLFMPRVEPQHRPFELINNPLSHSAYSIIGLYQSRNHAYYLFRQTLLKYINLLLLKKRNKFQEVPSITKTFYKF